MSNRKPLAGLRALIVEDEYFIADNLKTILNAHGALNVQMSGDIDDALLRIKNSDLDLAFLDINIHGEMAFAVADELKRRLISFVFVSGYETSKIPQRFRAIPNWGKPYDESRLVGDIQRLWSPPIVT